MQSRRITTAAQLSMARARTLMALAAALCAAACLGGAAAQAPIMSACMVRTSHFFPLPFFTMHDQHDASPHSMPSGAAALALCGKSLHVLLAIPSQTYEQRTNSMSYGAGRELRRVSCQRHQLPAVQPGLHPGAHKLTSADLTSHGIAPFSWCSAPKATRPHMRHLRVRPI